MSGIRSAQCGNCGEDLEVDIQILQNGCPHCGARKFVTKSEPDESEMMLDPRATIAQLPSGKFVINVERLFRTKDGDPIVLQDKEGRFRVAIPHN